MPSSITRMILNPEDPTPRKADVLYMTPNGQLQPLEGGGLAFRRERSMFFRLHSNPFHL